MTISAQSVSGFGDGTVVTDTGNATHPVPAEGLAVTLTEALTLPSGAVVGPTVPGQTCMIFQQPAPSAALDVEGTHTMSTGTAAAIFSSENH